MTKIAIPILVSAILLTGCSLGRKSKSLSTSKKSREVPWTPLGLLRESYLVAEKRLNKFVRVGMPRKKFIEKMKLSPVLGAEWAGRVTAGEGWFAELSRKNQYGALLVEEFSFGYYKRFRLLERFSVVIENSVVRRIARSTWTSEDDPPPPPRSVFSGSLSVEQEMRLISSYYRTKLQTRKAYNKILPKLKKIRIGWTSSELRLALGGSLYRLPNGYMYFQEGFLWNDGFARNKSGPLPVVIMPFGYRDHKGNVHKKVIVRAEGGLVTAVFWQPESLERK